MFSPRFIGFHPNQTRSAGPEQIGRNLGFNKPHYIHLVPNR